MKQTRLLISLLVTLNLALALLIGLPMAGIQLPWTPAGESERLSRQLRPDSIQILSQAAEPAVRDAPQAPESAPEPEAEKRCIALTGLSAEAADALQHAANEAGLSASVSGLGARAYWVHLPPAGGKDGATRRTELLTKAGITDFVIVREAGPTQFAVSLGLFRAEEAAQRLLEHLHQKGFKTAKITEREASGNTGKAEISGDSGALNTLLEKMKAHAGAQESCGSH